MIPNSLRISARASLPMDSIASSEVRVLTGSVAATRLAAPACTTITLTL